MECRSSGFGILVAGTRNADAPALLKPIKLAAHPPITLRQCFSLSPIPTLSSALDPPAAQLFPIRNFPHPFPSPLSAAEPAGFPPESPTRTKKSIEKENEMRRRQFVTVSAGSVTGPLYLDTSHYELHQAIRSGRRACAADPPHGLGSSSGSAYYIRDPQS